MAASDLELVQSASRGDDASFHTLVDRHAQGLYRVALSLSRNHADAEDLLQETFVGAFSGLKGFAGRSSVKTWLTQILLRQAAKAWRKSRGRRSTLSIDSDGGAAEDAALQTRGPADQVERRIDVMQVLQSLSAPHREVLVLREIRGLSYHEIAEALAVPLGTVESRLSRARAEFRARLDGDA